MAQERKIHATIETMINKIMIVDEHTRDIKKWVRGDTAVSIAQEHIAKLTFGELTDIVSGLPEVEEITKVMRSAVLLYSISSIKDETLKSDCLDTIEEAKKESSIEEGVSLKNTEEKKAPDSDAIVSKPSFADRVAAAPKPEAAAKTAPKAPLVLPQKEETLLQKIRRLDHENTLYGYSPINKDHVKIFSEDDEKAMTVRTSLQTFLQEKHRSKSENEKNFRGLIKRSDNSLFPAGTAPVIIMKEVCYTFSRAEIPVHVLYHWKEANCWIILKLQPDGAYEVVPYEDYRFKVTSKGGALQFTK